MALIIRAPEMKDGPALSAIRRKAGVFENTLGMITDSVLKTEEFLRNPQPGRHILVGEFEGQVVGIVGLTVEPHPRMNHVASFGISVDTDFQGRGFGKKLLEAIIDLSENWLMLVRLELGVIVDNEKAIALYESLGFVKEGVKKYAIKRNGVYVDEYIMARINKNIIKG